jgi:small acid-soluble spore protein D (minor alpha/beta-type SASP)
MGRRNKILVPEARQALDQLKAKIMNTKNPNDAKFEAAEEQGISLNEGYNGNIKAKDAGKIGGKIGGQMVKEMIKMAEQQLNKNQ